MSQLQLGPAHKTRTVMISGVTTTVISTPESLDGRCLLYLHGGGYVTGGAGSHTKMAAWVGKAVRARVWLPEYRLAPENVYPTARQDAVAVYASLLAEGQDPARVILAGDSAGGGLALATTLAIKHAGLPMPGALVLLSPWLDLSLSGDSVKTHAHRDAMLKPEWLRWCAEAYRGDASAADPGCSPLFADLHGLPPTLLHVGSEEILLDDAKRLAERAQEAKVQLKFQCFAEVGHVFQFHAGVLAEADQSLAQIGAFVEDQLRDARMLRR